MTRRRYETTCPRADCDAPVSVREDGEIESAECECEETAPYTPAERAAIRDNAWATGPTDEDERAAEGDRRYHRWTEERDQ